VRARGLDSRRSTARSIGLPADDPPDANADFGRASRYFWAASHSAKFSSVNRKPTGCARARWASGEALSKINADAFELETSPRERLQPGIRKSSATVSADLPISCGILIRESRTYQSVAEFSSVNRSSLRHPANHRPWADRLSGPPPQLDRLIAFRRGAARAQPL
jgi:hypothetical protein